MKVIDKIQSLSQDQGKVVFSFEFFPPKTEDGVDNLFERMDRMVAHNPSFCDITWGAGGSTADLTLDIANKMQNMICVETMMHLTCTNMPVEKIDHALETIKSNGIQNVLALRGDPPHGQDKFVQVEGGFSCALDLVKHIRAKYGDFFGITVAGYPEAHPDAIGSNGVATPEAYQSDLAYLKKKVDAGADLIVTNNKKTRKMKFKIYYGEEVRRFSLENTPTWYEFWELLHNEIFGQKQEFHKELYLQYTDNEGDNITVSTASEYDEMVKQFGETLLKLKIVDGRGSYFKDGPPAVPIALYNSIPSSDNIEDVIQNPPNVDEELIKKRVPLFLQSLFKEGRILPHHIPDWLSSAISIKPVIDPFSVDPIVDLDIDLHQLYLAIHARALKFLDEKQYDSSADYFLTALELNPSSSVAHYNLGCVYSLSSDFPRAIHHLQTAVDLGYSDLAHLVSDSDLFPLHSYPPFQQLTQTLASK